MEKRLQCPNHAMRLAVLLLLLAQAASPPQFKSCVNLVEIDILVTHSTGVPVRAESRGFRHQGGRSTRRAAASSRGHRAEVRRRPRARRPVPRDADTNLDPGRYRLTLDVRSGNDRASRELVVTLVEPPPKTPA